MLVNPLLLARHEQKQSNAQQIDRFSDKTSTTSTTSTAAGSNVSMHIKDIFNDGNDHVNILNPIEKHFYLSTDFSFTRLSKESRRSIP